MIYIASPYTHDDVNVLNERYNLAASFQLSLLQKGLNAISPIVLWHELTMLNDLPKDYLFWRKFNDELLNKCDAMYVLKIDGWQDSKGVAYEIDSYLKAGKPVSYHNLLIIKKDITLNDVWKLICKEINQPMELNFNKRHKPFNDYRNLCLLIYKELTNCRVTDLARQTNLHHATIIHALSTIKSYIAIGYDNYKFAKIYNKIFNYYKYGN